MSLNTATPADDSIPMKKFNLKVNRSNNYNNSNDPNLMTKIRTKSSDSNTSSSSSKMIGLGIARRPSDNLLLKYNNKNNSNYKNKETEQNEKEIISNKHGAIINTLPPPNKHLITKSDRPMSNDSISTKTSELFSSPSSDLNSRNSSIENDSDIDDNEDENNNSNMEESIISEEGNSTLILHTSENNRPEQKQEQEYDQTPKIYQTILEKIQDQPVQNKQRFIYNNNNNNSTNYHSANSSTPNFKHIPNNNFNGHQSNSNNFEKPSLYGLSNSTTAILPNKLPLTASQRYRLRKEQNETSLRNSIKKKEKFYDEQNDILELQDGDIDDSLIWNIPMASYSTSSFLISSSSSKHHQGNHISKANKQPIQLQSPSTANQQLNSQILQHTPSRSAPTNNVKKVYGHNSRFSNSSTKSAASMPVLDFHEMPTSPVPGINNVSDLQYIQETTRNLSSAYIQSHNRLSKSKLFERTQSAELLPLDLKAVSEQGMEDLLLISEDKLQAVSNSRPSWLPPKDPEEKKIHESQISKSISMASIEELDRSKYREERVIKDETNKAKLVLLLDRDITRNSSLSSLKKIVWETAFASDTRHQIYDEILQSKDRIISEHFIESFSDLSNLLNEMDFPKGKEVEIEQLIKNGITCKRGGQDNKPISKDLLLMLQIKSVSAQGLIPGDELLFHHFLIDDSFKTLEDVWQMVNLVQLTCFNDICTNKYDTKILEPRGIVSNYLLKTNDFKDEFNSSCLNSATWWNILERVDHDLFMWIMDIIVVSNSQCFKNYPIKKEYYLEKDWDTYRSKKVVVNYKILLSFALNVLLNYHFGFNDLKSLANLQEKNFSIPIPMEEFLDAKEVNGMLIRKWLHYYKKF